MTITRLIIIQCKNDPAFCYVILNTSPNHLNKTNNSTGMSTYLVGIGYMGSPASDIPMYQVFANRFLSMYICNLGNSDSDVDATR